MDIGNVIAFAKQNGYKTAEKLNNWNGYECYEPIMNEKDTSFIGPPLLILVKGESIRMSTVDEAYQQMDDSDDEEEIKTAKSFSELIENE